VQVANELSDKWASQPSEQHIPLSQHMIALSMKAVALATLGSGMKDEKQLLEMSKAYHVVSNLIVCNYHIVFNLWLQYQLI
jgi:hypothetical protein